MSQVLVLGKRPKTIEVNMSRLGDYGVRVTLELSGVEIDWPDDTDLTLIFSNGATFTATITGPHADFAEDYDVVKAMEANLDVTLLYVNGGTRRVLGLGMGHNHG